MSLKNSALTVTGGEVTSASRVDGRSDLWQVIVTPDNGNAVSVSLPVTTDCAATGAVCTEDGKKLSSGDRLFIPSTSTTGNNPATGAPTISGTAQAGETLTASTSDISDADGLDNVEYAYQWLADDMDIDGATGSGYTLTDDEVGKTIKVKVSFTDDADNEESLTSAATAQVSARPNSPATGLPTISGTVQSGETLTASTDDIGDADGLDNVSYNHQWLDDDADISGATDSTYTLTGDEVGKTIKVKVTFTDDKNNQETLTSTATGTVAAAPVPLTRQPGEQVHEPRWYERLQLRYPVQRGVRPELQDHQIPRLQCLWWLSAEGSAAPERTRKQHRLEDNGAAGRQRGCDRRAAHHHGLRGSGGSLHGGRQEALQQERVHRLRSGLIDPQSPGAQLPGQRIKLSQWTAAATNQGPHTRTGRAAIV